MRANRTIQWTGSHETCRRQNSRTEDEMHRERLRWRRLRTNKHAANVRIIGPAVAI